MKFMLVYSRYREVIHALTLYDAVVVISILVCLGIQLQTNWFLFDSDYHLTQDYAATSIGAYEAFSTGRVYGTPSWNNYYHPGSAWMYVQAMADYICRTFVNGGLSPVGVALVSRIAVNFLVMMTAWLVLRSCEKIPRGEALIMFCSAFAWVLSGPQIISSFWEPYIGSTVYFLFLILCISAMLGSVSAFLTSVAVGGICVQIQLSFITVVAITLAATGYLFFFSIKNIKWNKQQKVKHAAGLLAAMLIGGWPMWYDLFINSQKNIRDLIAYSNQTSHAPSLTFKEAINLTEASITVPAIAYITAIAIAVMLIYSLNKRHNAEEGQVSGVAIKLPWVCGALGLLSSFLFYFLLAKKTYAPAHSGAYGYVAAGFIFSAILLMFYGYARDIGRYAILIIGGVAPLVALGDTVIDSGGGLGTHVDVVGIMHSRGMTKAVTQTKDIAIKRNSKVGIWVQFPPPGEHVTDKERQLPWSIAVGLANELLRTGTSYCVVYQPKIKYASDIIKKFTDSEFCSSKERIVKADIGCNGAKVQLSIDSEKFTLANCE